MAVWLPVALFGGVAQQWRLAFSSEMSEMPGGMESLGGCNVFFLPSPQDRDVDRYLLI